MLQISDSYGYSIETTMSQAYIDAIFNRDYYIMAIDPDREYKIGDVVEGLYMPLIFNDMNPDYNPDDPESEEVVELPTPKPVNGDRVILNHWIARFVSATTQELVWVTSPEMNEIEVDENGLVYDPIHFSDFEHTWYSFHELKQFYIDAARVYGMMKQEVLYLEDLDIPPHDLIIAGRRYISQMKDKLADIADVCYRTWGRGSEVWDLYQILKDYDPLSPPPSDVTPAGVGIDGEIYI